MFDHSYNRLNRVAKPIKLPRILNIKFKKRWTASSCEHYTNRHKINLFQINSAKIVTAKLETSIVQNAHSITNTDS